jgi:hypothetical protein
MDRGAEGVERCPTDQAPVCVHAGARAVTARELGAAILCCGVLAILLLGPAMAGRVSVAPEGVLDYDPLYRDRRDVRVPGGGDFTLPLVDLPRDLVVAQAVGSGRLPMWNPLSACGAPLWAEQGGPFFPLKLPFYLSPSKGSYAVFLCLRLIVAGVGAWALARYRG